MTELGDFPLHAPEQPAARPPGSRFRLLVAVALILGGVTAGVLYWIAPRQSEEAPPPAVVESPAPAEPGAAPEPRELEEVAAEPEPLILPFLDQSDTLLRELAVALSSHPDLAAWLVTDELIRTFTVAVENIADGQNPAPRLSALAPKSGFRTTGRGADLRIDQEGYDRYNGLGDLVASLDAAGAVRLYEAFTPLIVEAYRELGHPEGGFDETLERALRRLLDTPVVEREVLLIARLVYYEFADPMLEALSPVQKQLLDMGPRNVRLIQAKLRDLAVALGIPAERLPPSVVILPESRG